MDKRLNPTEYNLACQVAAADIIGTAVKAGLLSKQGENPSLFPFALFCSLFFALSIKVTMKRKKKEQSDERTSCIKEKNKEKEKQILIFLRALA